MNPGGGTDGVSAKMNLTGGELVSIFPEDSSINSMRATTPTAYSPSPTNLSSANSDNGGGGSKNVSVNVYGVNNPMQFTQSRMAISRAARYV